MRNVITYTAFERGHTNIERIYRGQPALVGGKAVKDVLSAQQLEAAHQAAENGSYKEIAAEMSIGLSSVRTHLHGAYGRLGIVSKAGLAPYFPLDPDSALLKGKRLTDLQAAPSQLEILEALSVGLSYQQIATTRYNDPSTLRTHVNNIGKIWTDTTSALMSARVANGIRASYMPIVDAHPEVFGRPDLGKLTLPALVEIEPLIIGDFPEA